PDGPPPGACRSRRAPARPRRTVRLRARGPWRRRRRPIRSRSCIPCDRGKRASAPPAMPWSPSTRSRRCRRGGAREYQAPLYVNLKARPMVLARRLFEDFTVGLRFRSSCEIAITAERIKSFAAEFDPQPFHVDDQAGRQSLFGGRVASGWHTAAVAMRLIVDSDLGLSGQGAGVAVEAMRWLVPVRAGDSLRVEGTV